MNYEVQNALSRKVDDWKHHALEQKVSSLECENNALLNKIGYLEGKVQNHYSAIENLIRLIIDNGVMPKEESELVNLRQYLY